MPNCANCGKTIDLWELNEYFFQDKEEKIIIKCNSCTNYKNSNNIKSKKNQFFNKYLISYSLLILAFIFLFSFFMWMNPFIVIIAIFLALFTIGLQFKR